jgi:hypothetical protein
MTTPSKRTTAQVWEQLESIADDVKVARANEAEAARIAALDREAVDRELRAAGIDPAEAADVGMDMLQAASPDAPVPAAATSRPRGVEPIGRREKSRGPARPPMQWVPWLAAAAIVVLVLTAFAKRQEIQAWLQPEPPRIQKEPESPPRQPSPEELAASLRERAYGSCGERLWARCERQLNEAQKLDPAGETDPRVQQARKAIDDGLRPDPELEGKPRGK